MPWGTQGSTSDFATAIDDRGQRREVHQIGEKAWIVDGETNQGDTFESYEVSLWEGRYECSCYAHAYGDVRRRRICGHVRDVMYWRRHHDEEPADQKTGVAVEERRRRHQVPTRTNHQAGNETAQPSQNSSRFSPRDPSLGLPPLPDQFEAFRPHQWAAIQEVLDAFQRRGKRVVFLDAPTGSGKTLIGETVRRLLKVPQTLYVCNNKSLQDQFSGDFTYAKVLKGRANYPTLNHPDDWPDISAADCNRTKIEEGEYQCDECWEPDQCPYRCARTDAELAPLAVLNTAYLLAAANGAHMFTERGLVICDEADELESELMRHIEVVVSKGVRNWLGIDLPDNVSDTESWRRWLDMVAGRLTGKAGLLSTRDRKQRKRRKSLKELVDRIKTIIPQLDDEWVVDGYEDARRRRGTIDRQTIRFRPVQVKDLATEYLWGHADRWLLMSATIISAEQMAKDLGLPDGSWESVEVPSTFPPASRPVYVDRTVGPVIRSTEEAALPKLVRELETLAGEWASHRILVHTHSYSLTTYAHTNLSVARPTFAYMNSRQRDGILDRWLATPDGILLAPSFDRGIDLPDDACRIQVIAKVPFPYLGDKQVSKRMRGPGGQVWYVVETIRSMVQATGRIVRSEDDWGACVDPHTLVLRADMRWVFAKNLHVGDKLIAFDDEIDRDTPENAGRRHSLRRWRIGEVEATGEQRLPRYRISLETGEVLYATADHRWICEEGQYSNNRWIETAKLKPGYHLLRYFKPWLVRTDWKAGWMSGFMDGEGCLSVDQGRRNRHVTSITAVQNAGPVFDMAVQIAKESGFDIAVWPRKTTLSLNIQGGFAEHLRFLGQFQPQRLTTKLVESGLGQAMKRIEAVKIEAVEYDGYGPVTTLQTSTGTYITEGFGSHNTYILDGSIWRLMNENGQLFPSWWREAVVRGMDSHSREVREGFDMIRGP